MTHRHKFLSASEIEEVINNFTDSEDDLDGNNSDCDEIYNLDPATCRFLIEPLSEIEDDEPFDIENIPVIVLNSDQDVNDLNIQNIHEVTNETCEIKELKKKYNNVIWKKKHLDVSPEKYKFSGDESLPAEVLELQTPLQIFNYFFDSDLKERTVNESNYYATESNIENTFSIIVKDLEKFIGVCILTSVHQLTSLRRYWSHEVGNIIIRETISINHFEKIRKYIHFNCNGNNLPFTSSNHDRLLKIRPVIEALIKNFQKIPVEQNISIDEQICSSKGRSYLKQYMPMKPHKWGYKCFVLSGVSGFTYNFELFSGQENNKRIPTEINLGSSSNVVIRLLRNVPRYVNHHVYFDNYYTSLPLVVELNKIGIQSIGTVRRGRLPSCKLPTECFLKDKPRGFAIENVCTIKDVDVSVVLWKDTKYVTLLSTFAGELPTTKVDRYIRSKKLPILVDCPQIIVEYNKHMGGVDLLDSLIGRHKIKLRSKKWYIRVFYHLLDITVVNCWLLSKRIASEKGTDHLTLIDFRIQLAESLCKANDNRNCLKRGRPSTNSISLEIDVKHKKPNACHLPSKDIRLDNIAHFLSWTSERQRCKLPGCSKLTFVMCEKCNIHLCFNKDRNCVAIFHGRNV